MSTLARALEIAHEAHAGQVDKAGRPYIEHVLRVVAGVQTPAEKTVAALHDVVEDSDWTILRLGYEGFSAPVLAAVSWLTRYDNVPSHVYYRCIRDSALALTVKLADIRDNADPARLALLPERDRERLSRKYAAALAQLGAAA